MERFTAILALVAGGGAVLLLVSALLPVASVRSLHLTIRDSALWLAFIVAATAMAGSLWFSESAGFEPCRLCWYQRIAMYSCAVILLVGALRRDRDVRWYVVPLASIGVVISTYHYLIEWNPQWEATSCSATVPCTALPFPRQFGFVSLSFMALCGFAAILTVLLIPRAPSEQEHQPDGQEHTAAP